MATTTSSVFVLANAAAADAAAADANLFRVEMDAVAAVLPTARR